MLKNNRFCGAAPHTLTDDANELLLDTPHTSLTHNINKRASRCVGNAPSSLEVLRPILSAGGPLARCAHPVLALREAPSAPTAGHSTSMLQRGVARARPLPRLCQCHHPSCCRSSLVVHVLVVVGVTVVLVARVCLALRSRGRAGSIGEHRGASVGIGGHRSASVGIGEHR